MRNVSANVQRMTPCPTWLSILFCGLFLASAAAQRKDAAGVIPPQPVELSVKVQRGGKTEIPLRVHGRANEALKFLIRTAPVYGKLSEPTRATDREAAVVVYEPPANLAITSDKFFYAAQGSAGVSSAVQVSITITDLPPRLGIPDAIDFGTLRAGGSTTKLLEISNRGGGLVTGEVIVEPPWRIDGPTAYRLGAGDIAVFKVIFAPTTGGTFEKVARFTSDPTHSTTLRGSAEAPIVASPAQVILRAEVGDPTRTGAFELRNQTDEPRTLQLKSDPRLQLPPQVTVEARGKISVPVQTAPGDVHALNTEIRIEAPDLDLRIPVKAPVTGATIRASPAALAFARVPAGRPASMGFELENIGGAAGEVTWTIGPPFRVNQGSALLLPGEKRSFVIEIETNAVGRYRAWLQCKAGAQSFEVPVDAEVVASGRQPRGSSPKTGATSAPSSPETETPAPDQPRITADQRASAPAWMSDAKLPQGVKVRETTPTSATVEWPASMSPATNFRVDLRQLARSEDGGVRVTWLELGGVEIKQAGQNYAMTIHGLQPGQPWTVRVLPIAASGEAGQRLFAVDFFTPPKQSILPRISPLKGLICALVLLVGWQIYSRWRRRK
jgi:hypothetical protein